MCRINGADRLRPQAAASASEPTPMADAGGGRRARRAAQPARWGSRMRGARYRARYSSMRRRMRVRAASRTAGSERSRPELLLDLVHPHEARGLAGGVPLHEGRSPDSTPSQVSRRSVQKAGRRARRCRPRRTPRRAAARTRSCPAPAPAACARRRHALSSRCPGAPASSRRTRRSACRGRGRGSPPRPCRGSRGREWGRSWRTTTRDSRRWSSTRPRTDSAARRRDW